MYNLEVECLDTKSSETRSVESKREGEQIIEQYKLLYPERNLLFLLTKVEE
jgi:hypothetical protein